MTTLEVNKLFESFNDLKVLIVGDVMVDAYIWGNVNRISPEAPVPVFEAKKRENRLGGAANVALNVQSLGATPILCGIIGNDIKGKVFKEVLADQALTDQGIIISNERLTTCKTRIISSSHHMLRVDEEVLEAISKTDAEELIKRVKTLVVQEKVDVVIFEDYDKGLLNENIIQEIVDYLNSNNIPSCVDPKKDNFNAYKNTTLFKPNFKEFTVGLKEDIKKGDIDTLMQHAAIFSVNHNIENVMITLSEHGVMLFNEDIKAHIPAEIRNISDVSGAGDTVISTAALALARNIKGKELITLANLAGGLVCEEVGVVPINKERLRLEFTKRICE